MNYRLATYATAVYLTLVVIVIVSLAGAVKPALAMDGDHCSAHRPAEAHWRVARADGCFTVTHYGGYMTLPRWCTDFDVFATTKGGRLHHLTQRVAHDETTEPEGGRAWRFGRDVWGTTTDDGTEIVNGGLRTVRVYCFAD